MSKGKELSITKLTEDLEALSEDALEKSEEEIKEDEDTEKEELGKYEDGKEEEVASEDEEKDKEEKEDEEKDKEEELDSEEDEKEESKEAPEAEEEEGEEDKEEEVEKSKSTVNTVEDEVSKSTVETTKEGVTSTVELKPEAVQSTNNTINEGDLLNAFEAVVKSYGNVVEQNKAMMRKIEAMEVNIAELTGSLALTEDKATEVEEVTKSDTGATEEVEDLTKSEEVVEGKAVDYVQKSVEEEVELEEETQVEEFRAINHVKDVVDYFTKNMADMSPGDKASIRGAVSRVKGGRETQADIEIFEGIVANNKK